MGGSWWQACSGPYARPGAGRGVSVAVRKRRAPRSTSAVPQSTPYPNATETTHYLYGALMEVQDALSTGVPGT